MGENRDKRLGIRLNPGVFKMLEAICEVEKLGKSAMVRKLIIDKYYEVLYKNR